MTSPQPRVGVVRFPGACDDRDALWAVSRHGEFIGTMPSADGETTNEFEVRCVGWLATLLG